MTIREKLQEIKKELSLLEQRAINVDYKNLIPTLPKENKPDWILDSTMSGFTTRLSNWKRGLFTKEEEFGRKN